MNPECQQGKHGNCNGETVNDQDEFGPCPCDCHLTHHATTCALLVRHAECDCPFGRKPGTA